MTFPAFPGIVMALWNEEVGVMQFPIISQVSAFGLMVLVTMLAGLLALVYDTQWLAVLGLVGGFLTPIMLSTGQSAPFVLMSYMVVLNGGILTIAVWKRWKVLNTLG